MAYAIKYAYSIRYMKVIAFSPNPYGAWVMSHPVNAMLNYHPLRHGRCTRALLN